MKRCKRCGAVNSDANNFCTDCGARLNSHKPAYSQDGNFVERFKNSSILFKLVVVIVAVYLFFFAVGIMGHVFFGMPLGFNTEWDTTDHQSEFDSLDIDGDGALSFYEAGALASNIPYDNLSDIFDYADKNDNGILKGGEFDSYLFRMDSYYKSLEKQQKAKEKASEHKTTSSSSSSTHSYQDDEDEICPICGGDEFSEFYNAQYGEMNWKCDYCGEIFRSDDEFYAD